MKNETILIGAAVLIGGWFLWKKSQQTGLQMAAPVAPLPGELPSGGIQNFIPLPPVTSVATGQAVAIPSPGGNISTATGQNKYATVAQETLIFNWIKWMKASDQAAFFAAWPSMTQTEVNNLVAWANGTPGGIAWDIWRTKYQIDV